MQTDVQIDRRIIKSTLKLRKANARFEIGGGCTRAPSLGRLRALKGERRRSRTNTRCSLDVLGIMRPA